MARYYLAGLALLVMGLPSFAQSKAADATKAADPTQNFVSPLGLGTGATVAVTQKGTDVTAAIAGQIVNSPVNFWQLGVSGTTNTNGQATVFSSHDGDAPGFKGKFGLGKSSFIKNRPVFTRTAGEFRLQAWCRDLLGVIDKGLPPAGAAHIAANVTCKDAIELEKNAVNASPPVDPITGKLDEKTTSADDFVLSQLALTVDNLTPIKQLTLCETLKSLPAFYAMCPGSDSYKSAELEHDAYPGLDTYTKEVPGKLQWKLWGSWAPTLTSVAYRPVTAGVADLSDKQNWTKLLNTGVGDFALYYGSLAFGVEGGYGQTVQIKTQNVCNNTTSGTYTAQQCDMAMLGKPNPTNAWMASTTLQLTPLPLLGKGAVISTGAQVVYSYLAPASGGHSSELALPFYLAPSASPMSFVVGIQPTWDWNTDPKVGNKFSISVFAGARPPVSKQ
jgi:hypothetical protein